VSSPLEHLDFLYTPSRDVAADLAALTEAFGARTVFAIEGTGARVAAVELAEGTPLVLLADHLHDERTILVFRVADLSQATTDLEDLGWRPAARLEIPHGPCSSFETPGGQRIALYQLTRPEVAQRFDGRRDF
jgi:hypothetical protein